MRKINLSEVYVSALTIAELRRGIEKFEDNDPRRLKLEEWYLSVDSLLVGRVVDFDKNMAVEWGRIMGASARVGKPKPEVDMLIAATAKKRGMTLVTRNVKDMEGVDVPLFNPFE